MNHAQSFKNLTPSSDMSDTYSDDQSAGVFGDEAYVKIIDKLRELGIAEMVSLPQLVVVGDQSSGKSSVLESLTGFAFPRAPGLCTRYVTQITCRRDDFAGTDISIIPGPGSSDERIQELGLFKRSLKPGGLNLPEVFLDVRGRGTSFLWATELTSTVRPTRSWASAMVTRRTTKTPI
jgi:hypothetical protein